MLWKSYNIINISFPVYCVCINSNCCNNCIMVFCKINKIFGINYFSCFTIFFFLFMRSMYIFIILSICIFSLLYLLTSYSLMMLACILDIYDSINDIMTFSWYITIEVLVVSSYISILMVILIIKNGPFH